MSDDDPRPLVSVVLPTYERPELLVDAVRSVCQQTYHPIELVVVDDGSTRPAREVLADVDVGDLAATTIRRHEENRGANAARNTGIELARGEFLAFLDDDDYWKPPKLARQVRALQTTGPDVGVVFVGQEMVDAAGSVTEVRRPVAGGDFTANLARGETYGTFSTVLVRADVFEDTGMLDESFPRWQDREWYFRLAEHYDAVTVDSPLTVRRFLGQDRISDRYDELRDVVMPKFREKHFRRIRASDTASGRRFLATLYWAVGASALAAGRYRDTTRLQVRSLACYPFTLRPYLYLLLGLGGGPIHRLVRTIRRRRKGATMGN